MGTPVTNFGKVTVSTGYGAGDTSIALSTGHGSRLPSTFSYPLVWWNSTDYPDPADDPNREIVTVTARSSDTLTVTRGAESTGASTKNTAGKTYKMALCITKAMWDSIFERALSQSFRGLQVRTHPDHDVDDKKILFSADSIVMDDGEEIADWSNIVVDITASGANGLDTGSEGASRWYSIWAIYNGTTKAGLLHREKDYLLDENFSTTDDGAHALRDNSARTKLNQGFQIDTAGPLAFVDVKLLKTGSPTGNYWFTIESNSGGVPSGTALATSDKYDVSRLTTTAGWVRIPFRTPASLSAATQYHLVLQGDFTISGANYMSWRADTSAAGYTRGSKAAYDGATWTNDTDDDFMFKIYIEENDAAVTLPSGYTQKALIGFVYNDASSNFKHFWQQDRTVFCGHDDSWQVGALTNTTPTLVDLAAFLPPRACQVEFLAYNGTAATMTLGVLEATDIGVTGGTEFVGATRVVLNTGYTLATGRMVLSDYQGMMFVAGAGTFQLYILNFSW